MRDETAASGPFAEPAGVGDEAASASATGPATNDATNLNAGGAAGDETTMRTPLRGVPAPVHSSPPLAQSPWPSAPIAAAGAIPSGALDDTTQLQSRSGNVVNHAPTTPPLGLPTERGSAPRNPLPTDATMPLAPNAIESSSAIPMPTADPVGALNTYIGEPARAVEAAGAARVAQRSVQRDADFIRDKARDVAVTMHNLARDLEPLNEISSRWDDSDPRKLLVQRSFAAATRADNLLSLMMQALARLSMSAQVADTTINALQSERERLATLYQIAQELNSALDLEQLLGRVMTQLIEVIHAERGLLLLWDDQSGRLQFMAARGADGQPLTEGAVGHSSNIVRQV